jgi:hypothetical protein
VHVAEESATKYQPASASPNRDIVCQEEEMSSVLVRLGLTTALMLCLSACKNVAEADDLPDGSSGETDTDSDGDTDADTDADSDSDADTDADTDVDPSLDPCEGYDAECELEVAVEDVAVGDDCGIDVEAVWVSPDGEGVPFDPCLVNVYLYCETQETSSVEFLASVPDCCWGDAWSWKSPGRLVLCEDTCTALAEPGCYIELDFGCKSEFNACESPPY